MAVIRGKVIKGMPCKKASYAWVIPIERSHMSDKAELLFNFKEHLSVLNRSPATIKTYSEHVQIFLDAAGSGDIRQVTQKAIESYIVGLFDHKTKDGKPYRVSTICVKIRSIKRFFEYLEKSNVIFINPAERITEPQKEKDRIKSTLSPTEVDCILHQPNLGTLTGIRDRTILEVFYATGIRLNELCNLTVYDADLQGGVIRVKGKGRKDRVVPMGKHAKKFLREYIAKARPRLLRGNRTNRHLFADRYGKPISGQVTSIMIRTHARAAKIKKQVTAHTFRHTFATVLVKNGADIAAVQEMLGHSDIKTTEIYIRSLGLDVKAAHKRTHPRETDNEPVQTPQIERIKGSYERRRV